MKLNLSGKNNCKNCGTSSSTSSGVLNLTKKNNDTSDKCPSKCGVVTFIDIVAGAGIQVDGGPVTSSGTFIVTNTAPDVEVELIAGTDISITGTYPSFTISATGGSGTITPEIINITTETEYEINWTPTRVTNFGDIPHVIDFFQFNGTGYEKVSVPIVYDDFPPSFTKATVYLPGVAGKILFF